MRNFSKLFAVIALVALLFAACATTTTIGGTADPHGLISMILEGNTVVGPTEIGSYMVILNLIDIGYGDYAAAVMSAEAGGKQITTVNKWYYVLNIVKAYSN